MSLARDAAGTGRDVQLVRRTRIDGDSWDIEEVPLAEDFEAYRVDILSGETVIRSVRTDGPGISIRPRRSPPTSAPIPVSSRCAWRS